MRVSVPVIIVVVVKMIVKGMNCLVDNSHGGSQADRSRGGRLLLDKPLLLMMLSPLISCHWAINTRQDTLATTAERKRQTALKNSAYFH